jgi:hypothetical protein
VLAGVDPLAGAARTAKVVAAEAVAPEAGCAGGRGSRWCGSGGRKRGACRGGCRGEGGLELLGIRVEGEGLGVGVQARLDRRRPGGRPAVCRFARSCRT